MRMNPRWANRTDANKKAIVDALRAIGCVVYDIQQPFDLLVWRGFWRCLEVKEKDGKLTAEQAKELGKLGLDAVRIVRTPEAAIEAMIGQE
jgi:hypothetical protein